MSSQHSSMAAQSEPAAKARRPQPPAAAGSLLIRGAHVVTVNDGFATGRWDVRVEDGRITKIGERLSTRKIDRVVDAKGLVLVPGFVQAHVHVCQTLFRSQADEMALLDWLRERIWPLEGAMERADMQAAARLGFSELLLGGTTALLDMGTVRHTDVLFEQAERFGMRYSGGKALMDSGQGYPPGLRESTDWALSESIRLCERWHGAAGGRLRYAFSPRFVLSCSETAMRRSVAEARARGALLHTHAAENREEVELVRQRTGRHNVEQLHHLGFTGPDVLLAHGIWLSTGERRILRETGTRVVHCPSANLKLASGIARVPEMLDEGMALALGADGAAFNNTLDAFMEMRLAAMLHNVRGGPAALPARAALRLATRQSAEALGLTDVGQIAPGYKADLVLLDLAKPHSWPDAGDLHSRIVFSGRASDVHSVFVDGIPRVEEGVLVDDDVGAILRSAKAAARRVRQRAEVAGSASA